MTSNCLTKFIFVYLFCACSFAQAQEEWQVLVLTTPEVTVEKIAASNLALAYKKAEDAITAQLVNADIEVSDKSLLQTNDNMSDQALFSLNRDDINLAIRYRLDINEESTALVNKWHLYLSAYVVDLETKKKIETHSEERLFSALPNKCDVNCFDLWLAKQAGSLAQDLGAVLVEKLNSLPRRYRYEITFKRFTANELVQIHDYLENVDGYVYAKLLEKYATEKQWLHQIEGRKYRYISHMPADVLDVALQKQLTNIGIPVRNSQNNTRKFVIMRAGVAYLSWYIASLAVLILLFYLFYASQMQKKHRVALSKLAHGQHAQQWLDYYKNMSLIAVPKIRAWYEQEKKALDDVKTSNQLNREAWLYADQGDYENALRKVDQALAINADNELALDFKNNIVDFRRGYDRLLLASKEAESHPEQAIKLLYEALALNPHLKEKIDKVIERCELNLSLLIGRKALQQAQQAIADNDHYLAFSVIDNYLSRFERDNYDSTMLNSVKKLRGDIEKNITPLQGAIIGLNDLAGYYLFSEEKVEIARKITDPRNSFAIGYKRISRLGKQSQLVRNGNEFYLTDQGSTNSSIYGGLVLTPHQAVKISDDKTLVLGGSTVSPRAAVCQLDVTLAKYASNALMLKLSKQSFRFVDDSNIAAAWPSMESDISSRWILMGEVLQIGIADNGLLDLGCIQGSKPIARLIYQNGFYLQPEFESAQLKLKDSMEIQIMIEQQRVYGKVPLQEGVVITIANKTFSFQSVSTAACRFSAF